jgi:uridine kinase
MDDFYKSSKERNKESSPNSIGWQFDWQRLEKEVLQPLTTSGVATYRRYDWNEDCLTDVISVRVDSSVIIEGIYSLRPELTSYYDMRLWVECSKEIRLQRGIARDGEQARSQWEDNWMKEEEEYVSTYHPHLHVDRIINGMPPLTFRSSQRARGKPR